ncbi:alpha/beta hydrolase YcfP [Shewanella sp. YLB-07]|uniref:alpha/beta hydrolase YcfP n=1 Tax=Shewanella sp. YLB-07 TaxID=2601268 RepID=UPI00128D3BAE|nr:alpha/beta hydrolase YcfP [Shewanella sp. YLB-07]MPY21656.1 alpha/beta hydrolase [Shewanella sp. YLB-07]
MILYLHGFDATSPGNHEKMRQLQFIDKDVRLVSYSTQHPKHDMQQLLNEVSRQLQQSDDTAPLILGVGLGAFWAERIGFLNGLRAVLINPNLSPEINMGAQIDRPEEYADITSKCVDKFRSKNEGKALVILSRSDDVNNNAQVYDELSEYYQVIWDEDQPHKFPVLASQLSTIASFKLG